MKPAAIGKFLTYFSHAVAPSNFVFSSTAAQKMASTHIFGRCKSIGPETREKLLELKLAAKSSDGGGKRYWSETLQRMGVEETESAGLILNVAVADSTR